MRNRRGIWSGWLKDKPLLSFNPGDFEESHVQPYSTDPSRTREILLEEAASTHSVEVCRGIEVREILRDGNQIVGVEAFREGSPKQDRFGLSRAA